MTHQKVGTQYGDIKVLSYLGNDKYECMCMRCGRIYAVYCSTIGHVKCCRDCHLKSVKKRRPISNEIVDSYFGYSKKNNVSLTEKQMRLVNLRTEGLTYREIGELMGCSRQRVEQLYKNAMVKLDKLETMNDNLKEVNRIDSTTVADKPLITKNRAASSSKIKNDKFLLTDKQIQTVALRKEGMSYGKIGKIAGISTAAAESTYKRAMVNLHNMIPGIDSLKEVNEVDLISKMEMELLTKKEKHAIELRVEGLTYREIGEIIGCSGQSVEQSYKRAMLKLVK